MITLMLIGRIRQKRAKTSVWIGPWIGRRKGQGAFHNPVQDLEEGDRNV